MLQVARVVVVPSGGEGQVVRTGNPATGQAGQGTTTSLPKWVLFLKSICA